MYGENKFQWNLNKYTKIVIQGDALENLQNDDHFVLAWMLHIPYISGVSSTNPILG